MVSLPAKDVANVCVAAKRHSLLSEHEIQELYNSATANPYSEIKVSDAAAKTFSGILEDELEDNSEPFEWTAKYKPYWQAFTKESGTTSIILAQYASITDDGDRRTPRFAFAHDSVVTKMVVTGVDWLTATAEPGTNSESPKKKKKKSTIATAVLYRLNDQLMNPDASRNGQTAKDKRLATHLQQTYGDVELNLQDFKAVTDHISKLRIRAIDVEVADDKDKDKDAVSHYRAENRAKTKRPFGNNISAPAYIEDGDWEGWQLFKAWQTEWDPAKGSPREHFQL